MNLIICLLVGFFFICSLCFLYYGTQIRFQKHLQEKTQIEKLKNQIQSYNEKLLQSQNTYYQYNNRIFQAKQELKNITDQIFTKSKKADIIQQEKINEINKKIKNFQQISSNSANYYIQTLQQAYSKAETGYTQKITRLKDEYNDAAAQLNNIKETRKATYQALLKEKQLKANQDNYKLIPSASNLDDIKALNKIKSQLHHPRILSMLIWQTYWQPLAKEKFPIILQSKTKMGIYKITNIKTNQCYIGQSTDIYKRWNEHCKAGLGIDTPAGNKLYKAIQQYGLQNFTFEILVECQRSRLNEKEKYFIELYQSNTYGYNGTVGNK